VRLGHNFLDAVPQSVDPEVGVAQHLGERQRTPAHHIGAVRVPKRQNASPKSESLRVPEASL
jgi:hypothetical protein